MFRKTFLYQVFGLHTLSLLVGLTTSHHGILACLLCFLRVLPTVLQFSSGKKAEQKDEANVDKDISIGDILLSLLCSLFSLPSLSTCANLHKTDIICLYAVSPAVEEVLHWGSVQHFVLLIDWRP